MATVFNGRVAISVEAVFEDVLDISTASMPVQYTAA